MSDGWFVLTFFCSQLKAKEVICQAVELVRELVSGMSNFLTYTEQVFTQCQSRILFSHTFPQHTRVYTGF